MAFEITLGFATHQSRDEFVERYVPRGRAQLVTADPEALSATVSVTSQSGAKEVCSLVVAFLAADKQGRVDLTWTGTDGQEQTGEVNAGAGREAELVALRLGAAARAATVK